MSTEWMLWGCYGGFVVCIAMNISVAHYKKAPSEFWIFSKFTNLLVRLRQCSNGFACDASFFARFFTAETTRAWIGANVRWILFEVSHRLDCQVLRIDWVFIQPMPFCWLYILYEHTNIYDRSKNNQGNLILWAGSRAEDTFMYHNNKDNSIKTPIIARYNTLRWDRERREYSSVYLSSYEQHSIRYTLPQRFVRFETFPCVFSRLPAIYLRKYLPAPRRSVLGLYQPPNIPRIEAEAVRPTWPGRRKSFCWSEARGEWPRG